MGAGEAVAERLGPHADEPRVRLHLIGGDQAHEAEAAGIGEADAVGGAVTSGAEAHVLVLARDGRRLLELAQLAPVEGEAAGHAQVGDPGLAGRQPHQQIFGPAIDPLDRRPVQPFGEAIGKGKTQVGTILAHPRQARAFQHRLEAATDGFDLGKFGHGEASPVVSG